MLRAPNDVAAAKASQLGLEVVVGSGYDFEFDRVVIAEPGVGVPWDLVPAGLRLLEHWDAAAPLWRYETTLADLGTPSERKHTQTVVRDLRLLPYFWELLFVRGNAAGKELLVAFMEESTSGGDKRLAFHRALYRVKPKLCALPATWLAELAQRIVQERKSVRPLAAVPVRLVRVEVAPGQFVKCYAGNEEKVKQEWRDAHTPRNERRRLASPRRK